MAPHGGRRDRVLFATLYNTGARVSEIIGLRRRDLTLEGVACVRLHGKWRKERAVPLWRTTAKDLRRWLDQIEDGEERPVFPNRGGQALSRLGVEDRLDAAVRLAGVTCISLRHRQISPTRSATRPRCIFCRLGSTPRELLYGCARAADCVPR